MLKHHICLCVIDQTRCRCSHGQEGAPSSPPSPPLPHADSPIQSQELPRINIYSSHLSCVIIGDNNYMNTEQVQFSETEEPHM